MDKLLIVWPAGLNARNHLQKFYFDFIKEIPSHTEIIILYKNMRPEIEEEIKLLFENKNIYFRHFRIKSLSDIWIKDWAPVIIRNNSKETAVQFIYNPSYIPENQKKLYVETEKYSSRILTQYLKLNVKEIPLTLDLGNFTHNGRDTIIITERVYKDNKVWNETDVIEILRNEFEVQNVIVVPEEPHDDTGHIDAMLRFVTENRIVVSNFTTDVELKNFYKKKIIPILQAELKNFKLIDIHNFYKQDAICSYGEILPATGNYINFLRLGSNLFIPAYGKEYSELDEINLSIYKENFPELSIKQIYSKPVADKGGVLNCMTWALNYSIGKKFVSNY